MRILAGRVGIVETPELVVEAGKIGADPTEDKG
jgi:hypothetical protein